MKEKRLNWREIWKVFEKRTETYPEWDEQKKIIVELVEDARNEKSQERKRKTVK